MTSPLAHQIGFTQHGGYPEEKSNNTEEDKIHSEKGVLSGSTASTLHEKPLSRSGSPSKKTQEFNSGITKSSIIYRQKQLNPKKVYVGGLPEHTRQEDLRSCFEKIGRIISIESKTGFGFVEFADSQSAEESVSKYNEGYFMGNKIRVELSRGGGRSARFTGDAGACFKCGQTGHWAKECLNHVVTINRRPEGTLMDRVIDPPPLDLVPRCYSSPRDDYQHIRNNYHDHTPPPRPSSRDNLEYKPRDYRTTTPRDHKYHPPVYRSSRHVDEHPRDPRASYSSRYDIRSGYYSQAEIEYNTRQSDWSPRDSNDHRSYDARTNYDKKPPPNSSFPPYLYGRFRTPPRNDFDKASHPKDYPEFRGRPMTPPRYSDNGCGMGDSARYRRRSLSPNRPLSYGAGNFSASLFSSEGYSNSLGNLSGAYPPLASRPNSHSIRGRDHSRFNRDTGDLVQRP